jgi:hypothetical protein
VSVFTAVASSLGKRGVCEEYGSGDASPTNSRANANAAITRMISAYYGLFLFCDDLVFNHRMSPVGMIFTTTGYLRMAKVKMRIGVYGCVNQLWDQQRNSTYISGTKIQNRAGESESNFELGDVILSRLFSFSSLHKKQRDLHLCGARRCAGLPRLLNL